MDQARAALMGPVHLVRQGTPAVPATAEAAVMPTGAQLPVVQAALRLRLAVPGYRIHAVVQVVAVAAMVQLHRRSAVPGVGLAVAAAVRVP